MRIVQTAPGIPLSFLKRHFSNFSDSYDADSLRKMEYIGGGGVHPLQVSMALAEKGHTVKLIVPSIVSGEARISDNFLVSTLKSHFGFPFTPYDPFCIFPPSAFSDYDVLHVNQFKKVSSLEASILGKIMGKRVFITDLAGVGRSFDYGRIINGFLLISHYSANYFQKYGDKIKVVYEGVDLDRFTREEDKIQEVRSNILGDNGSLLLLYVGQIRRHKRIEDLIHAFSISKRRFKRLKLAVCGGVMHRDYFERLQKMIPTRLKSDIVFTGFIPDKLLPAYYFASDFFVFPSSHELLCLAVLEAMACSKAVVATAIGGMKETVVDGKTGFLVPANEWRSGEKPGVVSVDILSEKIAYLIEHDSLRDKMGRAGRKRVEAFFTWDLVADRIIEAYNHFSR